NLVAGSNKCPVVRVTIWAGTRITKPAAGNQVSHPNQPTDHLRDRPNGLERMCRPYPDIVRMHAQTSVQPTEGGITQQRPRRRGPRADGPSGVYKFIDRIVKHFNSVLSSLRKDAKGVGDIKSARLGTVHPSD